MPIQIIICPIIVFIGAYTGFYISKKFQSRVRQLELCSLLLQRIRVYLDYEKTPTKELILKLAASDSLKELVFIKQCSQELEYDMNFPKVWKKCLEDNQRTLALTKEDYQPLIQLSEVIGAYDAQAQSDEIAVIENLIKQMLEHANEESRTTGKLYRSLGVLGGIAIAVLVI